MFILHADKNRLTVRQREPVTSGSVNVYEIQFEFSADWDGMERVAVFKAGKESRSVLLDDTNTCDIPWEVLAKPGVPLLAGVYGTRGGSVVLPTALANLGIILEGATLGEDAHPPTSDLWEQELDRKGDGLDYDGQSLSLMSGGKPLSTVRIAGGGGEGGTADHRALTNRDAEGQHPIGSITGLKERLDNTMTIGNTLSVAEILKIMEA